MTFKEWYDKYWKNANKQGIHPTMYEAQLDAYLAGREIQQEENKDEYSQSQTNQDNS